jgi:hypothetical protein
MFNILNSRGRATWVEGGAVSEGCYVLHPAGLVLFYWSDGALGAIPSHVFRTPQEA